MSASDDDVNSVTLLSNRGETSRFIQVKIDEEGDLIFSCQDVGKLPKQLYDDEDYEFWVTVRSGDKDRLLLHLIESIYKGNFFAVDDFRKFLKPSGIPFEWNVWT